MIKKFILASAILSTSALAGQSEINLIEQSARSLDSAKLATLTEQYQGYDQAFALYRLAVTESVVGDNKSSKRYLDQAMVILESRLESNSEDVEAMILLAQVYGFQIALKPYKGAYYGIKSASVLEQAKALAPENPRVHLVQGISDYQTPAIFGGSKSSAIKAFDDAIEFYQVDQNSGYHWGYEEAYVWRGLAQLALNNGEQAQADWQRAIELAPDYGWAKMLKSKN